MLLNQSGHISGAILFREKAQAFYELSKPRLSFLVVFSSAIGYSLASTIGMNWDSLLLFCIAGFLVSAGSVTVNQVMEVSFDALMKRTANRPLPSGRLSKLEAIYFALVCFTVGFGLLFMTTNLLAVVVSLVSTLLYCFLYTPLKRVGPIAVFVGAIPGALPPLIGWVAVQNEISHLSLVLFGIQFIWQFPHFWAIAWVADDDYKRAGFKLLPSNGGKDMRTAFNIMIYALFLIPFSLLPAYFGLTGMSSAIIAVVCGVLFLSQTFSLMRDFSRKSALRIMFGSFIYLPIVQVSFLIDKI